MLQTKASGKKYHDSSKSLADLFGAIHDNIPTNLQHS